MSPPILFLAPLSVRLSVRPSVCPSVRHTFVSALYLLNPWWDLQITLHKCQVWWGDVQCLWPRSGQGQGHNLRLNIVLLYFVSALYLLNPCWNYQITLHKCHKCRNDEKMCSAYVWPRSVQGQGHNLRLNSVWLYFVSPFYLLNPWWDLQRTLNKCQKWWDDVQCLCLTKVGSRSRLQSKIKQCMTVFRVRSISFEPLMGFTNIFAQMSRMMLRSQLKIEHCMTVFGVRYISFESLVVFTNNFA